MFEKLVANQQLVISQLLLVNQLLDNNQLVVAVVLVEPCRKAYICLLFFLNFSSTVDFFVYLRSQCLHDSQFYFSSNVVYFK